MPKDRQKRTVGHAPSAKRQFAQHIERVETGSSANLLARLSIQESKQDKQQLRREALLERLVYSKSHLRRVKRKACEQLASGLNDIQTVLDSLGNTEAKVPTPPDGDSHTSKPTPKTKPGQIGEGKGATLSGQQRKRVLRVERMRHPLILSNSQFSSNPFQTIRTHTQNTLVKHTPPES